MGKDAHSLFHRARVSDVARANLRDKYHVLFFVNSGIILAAPELGHTTRERSEIWGFVSPAKNCDWSKYTRHVGIVVNSVYRLSRRPLA